MSRLASLPCRWVVRSLLIALVLCLGAAPAGGEVEQRTAGLLAAQVAEPDIADESDRVADNRGLILVGSVVLVLVMIGGAVLVARDEAGRHDGHPGDDATAPRRGEAEGRHTARRARDAWPRRQ